MPHHCVEQRNDGKQAEFGQPQDVFCYAGGARVENWDWPELAVPVDVPSSGHGTMLMCVDRLFPRPYGHPEEDSCHANALQLRHSDLGLQRYLDR